MRPAPNRCPTHPGELLREDVIPATGVSKAELASLLGITRNHLNGILAEEKPITPSVAVRLGKLCGNGEQLWIRMQVAHDIWHANREVDISGLPALKAVA